MGATAALGLASLAGGYAQSEAQRMQGEFAQNQANINARFAELQGKEVLKRGDREAASHGKKVGRMISSQRATLAAQGIVVDSGTALQIQEDTREIGAQDAETIRNNAWREAFSLKQQAQGFRRQGAIDRMTSDFQARTTLINAGVRFAQAGLDSGGFGLGQTNDDFFQNNSVGLAKSSFESGKVGVGSFDPEKYGSIA